VGFRVKRHTKNWYRGGSLFDNGGWDLGHHGGYGRKYSYSFVLTWFCLKVDNIPIVLNIKIMTKYPTHLLTHCVLRLIGTPINFKIFGINATKGPKQV
jgi:hypothetical protein